MNIKILKEDLLDGIQSVQGAVSTRSTLPVLSTILLEAESNSLKLTATDLDIAISAAVPTEVFEEGAISLPAKRFSDIIRESPAGAEIQIHARKNLSTVIESEKAVFKLMGMPKSDFPKVPTFEPHNPISIPQPVLNRMIQLTSFAVSRDEARYVLNGVLFAFKDKLLRLVATDGRRLAMVERELETSVAPPTNIIIPHKTIQELSRNLEDCGEVLLNIKENQLHFKLPHLTIVSRLIEGEFPNYEQVIPKKTKEQLWINTQKFLSAARRASIFTHQESQSVKIDLSKNRVVISKSAPDVGEVREELEAEYGGDDLSIGFNPNYLIDVLKNIDEDRVQFGLTDPEKPGMIKAKEDYTYIVLPMQLS